LGELLVREKMISLQQLQQAQEEAKRSGRRLGAALSDLGYVDDTDLTKFLAQQYSLPSINLADFEIDADVVPFKGRLLLQCDREIPFSLLREVMYTAGQAQFGEFKFVVYKEGD